MRKKLPILLLTVLFVLTFTLPAFAIVDRSEEFYVADYANVLSYDTEQDIIQSNAKLESYCKGAQIVVVTIDYLDTYEYSDEYANALFNSWGVGDDNENNGMLLLLVVEEGKGWLATGAGIKGEFNDDTASRYLDRYFWDEFDRGNYDEAVDELFDELVDWYEEEYTGRSGAVNEYYRDDDGGEFIFGIIGIIFAIILIIVVISIFSGPRGGGYGGGGPRYGRRNNFFFIPVGRTYRRPPPPHHSPRAPRPPRPSRPSGGFGGFGGAGRGGSFGGGFGGGIGRGGGGFSGGGGAGRR